MQPLHLIAIFIEAGAIVVVVSILVVAQLPAWNTEAIEPEICNPSRFDSQP